jgi:putative FmdB family regulatory protein
MPLYGYECEDCQDEFEEFVTTFSKAAEVTCPECGSGNITRQLSMVAAMKSSSSADYCYNNPACDPSG